MTGYIIVSEVYITITFDSLSMSIDASLDNIHALLIVLLSTSSVYCAGRQNAIAAPNKHGLAFTSLWTATVNSVTLGRLQTVESAVHSVWDTHRSTSLSDTAMSASVWASDG